MTENYSTKTCRDYSTKLAGSIISFLKASTSFFKIIHSREKTTTTTETILAYINACFAATFKLTQMKILEPQQIKKTKYAASHPIILAGYFIGAIADTWMYYIITSENTNYKLSFLITSPIAIQNTIGTFFIAKEKKDGGSGKKLIDFLSTASKTFAAAPSVSKLISSAIEDDNSYTKAATVAISLMSFIIKFFIYKYDGHNTDQQNTNEEQLLPLTQEEEKIINKNISPCFTISVFISFLCLITVDSTLYVEQINLPIPSNQLLPLFFILNTMAYLKLPNIAITKIAQPLSNTFKKEHRETENNIEPKHAAPKKQPTYRNNNQH